MDAHRGLHLAVAGCERHRDPLDDPEQVNRDLAATLATSPQSHALSKDLRKRGWRFVGPTTMYAFMQAMGLVNDHLETCFRHGEVRELAR